MAAASVFAPNPTRPQLGKRPKSWTSGTIVDRSLRIVALPQPTIQEAPAAPSKKVARGERLTSPDPVSSNLINFLRYSEPGGPPARHASFDDDNGKQTAVKRILRMSVTRHATPPTSPTLVIPDPFANFNPDHTIRRKTASGSKYYEIIPQSRVSSHATSKPDPLGWGKTYAERPPDRNNNTLNSQSRTRLFLNALTSRPTSPNNANDDAALFTSGQTSPLLGETHRFVGTLSPRRMNEQTREKFIASSGAGDATKTSEPKEQAKPHVGLAALRSRHNISPPKESERQDQNHGTVGDSGFVPLQPLPNTALDRSVALSSHPKSQTPSAPQAISVMKPFAQAPPPTKPLPPLPRYKDPPILGKPPKRDELRAAKLRATAPIAVHDMSNTDLSSMEGMPHGFGVRPKSNQHISIQRDPTKVLAENTKLPASGYGTSEAAGRDRADEGFQAKERPRSRKELRAAIEARPVRADSRSERVRARKLRHLRYFSPEIDAADATRDGAALILVSNGAQNHGHSSDQSATVVGSPGRQRRKTGSNSSSPLKTHHAPSYRRPVPRRPLSLKLPVRVYRAADSPTKPPSVQTYPNPAVEGTIVSTLAGLAQTRELQPKASHRQMPSTTSTATFYTSAPLALDVVEHHTVRALDSLIGDQASPTALSRLTKRVDTLERENRLLEAALMAVLRTSGRLNGCPCGGKGARAPRHAHSVPAQPRAAHKAAPGELLLSDEAAVTDDASLTALATRPSSSASSPMSLQTAPTTGMATDGASRDSLTLSGRPSRSNSGSSASAAALEVYMRTRRHQSGAAALSAIKGHSSPQ